jgi:hypothetical protein
MLPALPAFVATPVSVFSLLSNLVKRPSAPFLSALALSFTSTAAEAVAVESLEAAVESFSVLPALMFASFVFALSNKPATSAFSKVSQNSKFAVPCKSFLTRSGSLTPGNSTKMRPDASNFWMFG